MNNELILKLEKLSNLELNTERREVIKKDLEKILAMVDKMNELNTDNVKPLIYVNEEPYMLRPDAVKGELEVEKAMDNAPKRQGNYFAVPKFVKI